MYALSWLFQQFYPASPASMLVILLPLSLGYLVLFSYVFTWCHGYHCTSQFGSQSMCMECWRLLCVSVCIDVCVSLKGLVCACLCWFCVMHLFVCAPSPT